MKKHTWRQDRSAYRKSRYYAVWKDRYGNILFED